MPDLPKISSSGGILVVSGTAFAPILTDLLKLLAPGVRVEAVVNEFFGPAVNVSGLLTGRDIVSHVGSLGIRPRRIIISSTMLRKNEQVFLDGMTIDDLQNEVGAPVQIAAGAAGLHECLMSGGNS